jgi:hypothetical protein
VAEPLWEAAAARRARARRTFVRDAKGQLRGRPSWEDFESPYLLSGLARCAGCGGPLVALTRSHGRRRVAFYGCAYHRNRGATICPNGLQIRQDRLEAAVLTAFARLLDAALIEGAVAEALRVLRTAGDDRLDRRTTLERERDLGAMRMRHLVDAVTRGQATDTLLRELQAEEDRQRALKSELAEVADLEGVVACRSAARCTGGPPNSDGGPAAQCAPSAPPRSRTHPG